jgi:hypothetical protein
VSGQELVLIVLVLLYFVPSVIAARRHHHNAGAIFVLNLLLGWTALGWIAALVWACTAVRTSDAPTERVACPYCREPMDPRAAVCPHCRRDVPEDILRARRGARLGVLVVAALVVAGCAAGTQQLSSSIYPAHTNAVFVTRAALPANVFEPIADLELSKGWYGSTDNTQQALADRARELGADAVINVKSWHAPSAFSWASPYSSGRAVKIRGDAKSVLSGIAGEWR